MIRKVLLSILTGLVLLVSLFPENLQYTVAKGDTLYRISQRFDLSVEDIQRANGMNGTELKEGMTLILPSEDNPVRESYVISRGDTLYRLSKRFDIPLQELMEINQLTSGTILKEGDILLLTENTENTQDPEEKTPVETGNRGNSTSIIEVSRRSSTTISPAGWPVAGERSLFSGNIEGVVIKADPGATVTSVSQGRVVWTGPYREFGEVILVDNGEFIYFYGGNKDLFVNVGQTVGSGTSLGRLENRSGDKAFMYFTVFKEGRVVDIEEVPRG